jgi:hypothetical protein
LLATTLGAGNVIATSLFSINTVFLPHDCGYRRDAYLAIVQLDRLIRKASPGLREIYVWLDEGETVGVQGCGAVSLSDFAWSFRSLGSSRLLTDERLVDRTFMSYLANYPESYVLIASEKPGAVDDVLAHFSALGLTMRQEPVSARSGPLQLDFVALRPTNAR